MARHVVATVDEIPPGERKIIQIAGRPVGVFNIGGEFFALRNACPHQGGPLCSGRLTGFLQARVPGDYTYTRRGEILHCPWHGWEFDVRTGQSWFDPAHMRVRTYPVYVEASKSNSEIAASDPAPESSAGLQRGPYIAETYDVSIERQLVIVEIPGT